MSTTPSPLPARGADALRAYRSKRNFALTPEPAESARVDRAVAEKWSFVVQKHWASRLHYDFRLELDGAMKSWAVPKGPSFDPKIKRMAVQVEDHPIAYAGFEGTIPPKQYGAGKVIVWDRGSWKPLNDPGQGYRDGNLKFELHGHKLIGKWVLVRMKGHGEKQAPWLLIKEKDAFTRSSAEYSVVDALPDSVQALGLPKRSEVAADLVRLPSRAKHSRQAGGPSPALELPSEAVPAELPVKLAPQLATLAAGLPSSPADWVYEIKFDGYRLLVRNDATGARLVTRNGHDWTSKLRSLHSAIEDLKLPPGWYDGEIVVPNESGIPDFGALQRSFDSASTKGVVIYLFDLPYVDGHDLRAAPLEKRRAVLKRLLSFSPLDAVRFSEEFNAAPDSVFASACKLGLEGVMAKRRNARYQSSRSADWLKLKCGLRQEFVIGGYTAPQGARSGLGALLLGVHDARGVLQHAGNVGTGFSQQTLKDLKQALDGLSRSRSPFDVTP